MSALLSIRFGKRDYKDSGAAYNSVMDWMEIALKMLIDDTGLKNTSKPKRHRCSQLVLE